MECSASFSSLECSSRPQTGLQRFSVENMRLTEGLAVCVTALLLARVCTAGQQTLSVTTIPENPYVMTQGSQLEGFCIDLLSELAEKLGFKYNLHVVKDGKYGSLLEDGTWNGMIGEVMRGEADLAVAPLTITAMRQRVVDMTTPFMQTGISFIMRKDAAESADPGYFHFLCPFSMETWVGILAAYLLTALCMCIAARLSPCEWTQPQAEDNSFTLLHSLWYAAAALTLQGAGPHPKATSGRVISAIWWLFTVVVLASYFANFTALRHTDTKHVDLESFEDLVKQDTIEYGSMAKGSTFYFFKSSVTATYHRIYEHMEQRKSYVRTTAEGIRRVQEGNYAFIGESVSLDLAAARHCNLTRSPNVIGMRGYGIVGPLGSPLVKNLSVAILELSELGKLDILHRKWWTSSCMGEEAGDSPLKSHSLKGMFLLLALGLGLGLLLALLELASKSQSSAKELKKSCCTVMSTELGQRLGNRREEKTAETTEKNKV